MFWPFWLHTFIYPMGCSKPLVCPCSISHPCCHSEGCACDLYFSFWSELQFFLQTIQIYFVYSAVLAFYGHYYNKLLTQTTHLEPANWKQSKNCSCWFDHPSAFCPLLPYPSVSYSVCLVWGTKRSNRWCSWGEGIISYVAIQHMFPEFGNRLLTRKSWVWRFVVDWERIYYSWGKYAVTCPKESRTLIICVNVMPNKIPMIPG